MGFRLFHAIRARHLPLADVQPTMAKADLRKAEIGHAIERARALSGLSLKEFAARIRRDERQVSRWCSGLERPQLDAVLDDPDLWRCTVQALAELSQAISVEIVVRMRKDGR